MKSEQVFIVFEGNSIRIPQKGHKFFKIQRAC